MRFLRAKRINSRRREIDSNGRGLVVDLFQCGKIGE